MLQQKWVVMAGDSITRFMFAALLRLLAEDGALLLISILACAYSKPQAPSWLLLEPAVMVPD